jgi:hypothetical protein
VVTNHYESSDIDWVTYSAHSGARWRYTRTFSQFDGLRVKVYIANGTHANYPAACSVSKCSQSKAGSTELGEKETRFDGGSPWERNSIADCGQTCLIQLPKKRPDSALYSPPDAWAAWPGRWGKAERKIQKQRAQGPQSPGVGSNGKHFAHPDQMQSTPRTAEFESPTSQEHGT